MQVHLPQADGVRSVVALANRWHRVNRSLLTDRSQATDGSLDSATKVRRVHGHRNIQRTEVTGNVLTHVLVGQVRIVGRRGVDLQNLRAEVRHVNAALNRVRAVNRVLEHDVRVAGLKLNLSDGLEELTRVDLLLTNTRVLDHIRVVLSDINVRERLTVDTLDIVRAEEVHVVVTLGQLKRDVRNDNAKRQRLDANLLVRVLTLGIQEAHDVRVVRVQVDSASTLTSTQLVSVGEGVLQQLHNRDDTGRLILDVLNRSTLFTQVAQQQRHTTAALGQLQRGVNGATNGLHVVLDTQQEAAHRLAALGLTGVEECRSSRLETSGDDLINQVLREPQVAVGKRESNHADTVFVALQVTLAVEGLQCVRGVVLVSTQESLKTELVGVGLLKQRLDVLKFVLLQNLGLVVMVLYQIIELLPQVVEEHSVLIDMLQEELPRSHAVFIELNLAVFTVQIQQRIERVVIQLVLTHRLRDLLAHFRHVDSFNIHLPAQGLFQHCPEQSNLAIFLAHRFTTASASVSIRLSSVPLPSTLRIANLGAGSTVEEPL